MQAASSWKPIETAPIDGSEVLITDGKQFYVTPGYWVETYKELTHWAEIYPPEGKP